MEQQPQKPRIRRHTDVPGSILQVIGILAGIFAILMAVLNGPHAAVVLGILCVLTLFFGTRRRRREES